MEYQEKKCTKCGEVKPVSEFYKGKSYKGGYRCWCRECTKVYKKIYNKNNIEKNRKRHKEYYKNNIKEIIKRATEWNKNNPGRAKQHQDEWLKNNPDYKKEYYKINAEKIKEKSRRWLKNNPEKARENKKRYYKENLEYFKDKGKKYRLNNPEKVREIKRKCYLAKPEQYREHARKYRADNREKLNKHKNIYQNKRRRENPFIRLNNNFGKLIWESLKGNKKNKHWENLVGYSLKDLQLHLEDLFVEDMTWDNYTYYGWHVDHIRPIASFNFTSYEDEEFKKCWALENLQPLWAKDNQSKSDKII